MVLNEIGIEGKTIRRREKGEAIERVNNCVTGVETTKTSENVKILTKEK